MAVGGDILEGLRLQVARGADILAGWVHIILQRDQATLGPDDSERDIEDSFEKRVEVLIPIEDQRLQAELRHILDTQLSDQRGAWDMNPDGSYVKRSSVGAKHSQQSLIERTERRLKEATRLRRRKVQVTTTRKKR